MAQMQEKCSNGSDDASSCVAAGSDNNFNYNNSNVDTSIYNNSSIDTAGHSVDELKVNAVSILPPLLVCTSTPCMTKCQSRYIDASITVTFSSRDDSGVCSSLSFSPSLPLTTSPSFSHPTSPSCCETATSTLPQSSFTLLPSSGDQSPQERLAPSSDSQPPIMCSGEVAPMKKDEVTTDTVLVSKLKTLQTDSEPFPQSGITSTPVSQSFSMHRERMMGKVAPYTPPDGISPITGHALYVNRTTTTLPLPSPSLGSSSSHPSQDEEEESEDEAYFTASHLSTTSPGDLKEESSVTMQLALRMNRVLGHFIPPVGRVVGSMVGVEYVDIITQLYVHNLPASGVITWLKPYLSQTDCIRMSRVCYQWRAICLKDAEIYRWLKQSHRKITTNPANKENISRPKDSGDHRTSLTQASDRLGDVQPTVRPQVKHSLAPPDLYQSTRKALKWDEIMLHCPLCHNMAKVLGGQDRAHCQNSCCQNDFCTRCLAKFHTTLPCPSHLARPRDTPASKKSKKQLQRLCNL